MTTKPTPIAALEQALNLAEGCIHDQYIAAARKALERVEAVVAAAWRDHRDATSHLRPGELGVVNLETYASMGCKSCTALLPFGKEGP